MFWRVVTANGSKRGLHYVREEERGDAASAVRSILPKNWDIVSITQISEATYVKNKSKYY